MSKIVYIVQMESFWKALHEFEKLMRHPILPSDFCKEIGVSQNAWDAYACGDNTLNVSRATDRKIGLLKTITPNTTHIRTLFKIIDAQETD